MKRSHLTLLIFMGAIAFYGCKKDYTCTCTQNSYNPLTKQSVYNASVTTIHDTKSRANSKCHDRENDLTTGHNQVAECELK